LNEILRIALVGNPNTGKSSLFNALTGLRQRTGNFPGITVDKTTGRFDLGNGSIAEVTDLPGTYSLFPKSEDEAVPYSLLLDETNPNYPDLVVYIADASNLKRNLVLLTQLIDLKLPLVLALNMVDQAASKGIIVDVQCLSRELGIPVVPINARKAQGIDALLNAIREGGKLSPSGFIEAQKYQAFPLEELAVNGGKDKPYSAVLKLHRSASVGAVAGANPYNEFRKSYHFDSGLHQREDLIYRYRRITELLKDCMAVDENPAWQQRQARIDKILTHNIGGYIIFLAILFIIFQAIFRWAAYPMDLIDRSIGTLSESIKTSLPPGVLTDLLANGILPGLSGVLVFIPQIAFLFFFIAIMEDTGYLARVAFLTDRTMRRFGLSGKSVIPLISGTACAVPAIMAARNIEHSKSRLITILVTPLMSCSARLPVYILLIGLAVPDTQVWGFLNLQGLALLGLYVLGFLAVIAGAAVFRLLIKNKARQYFILELPAYRSPNWRNVGMTVVNKVKTFVTQAGKIIVAISIVLWFLASFGPPGRLSAVDEKYAGQSGSGIEGRIQAEKLENSYAGMLGHAIEPAIRPLGYDWKIGIGLITSFAAREVFVGTMSTIYGLRGDADDFSSLKENMMKDRNSRTGQPVYTTATVASLLVFYVFAMLCMSTLATTYKETRSLKWTLIQLGYMTALAYLGGLLIFNALI
jgi:ferrous iron transport protein B